MGGEGEPTQPLGEKARHHTRQRDWHEGACGGRGGTLWVVALTGHGAGAGQPGVHIDRPGVARAGPTGPSCCAAQPTQAGPCGPGQTRPRAVRGQGDFRARLGQHGTTRSCLLVILEPGSLEREEERGCSDSSSTCCQRHPPGQAPVSREGENGGSQ